MDQDSATNQPRQPRRITWLLGSAALGALTMYLTDPDRGRRRRALAADKLRSTMMRTSDAMDVAARDFGNRMQGLRAQASRMLSGGKIPADDQVLAAHVRQKIGRAVSNPHSIHTTVQQGCVTLHGPVLADEKQHLLDILHRIPGVTTLDDKLEVHTEPKGISGLQGNMRPGSTGLQENWPPAWRAAAIVTGGTMGAYSLARRTPASILLAAAGLALIARGMSNVPLRRMAEKGIRPHGITLHKSIHIDAPPETVFSLWSKCENFPRFMSNVQEVRDLGEGRLHWSVRDSSGAPIEWDAKIKEFRRPEILSWSSEPDATMNHSGAIRFQPEGEGTRVSLQISYSPPTSALAHGVQSLFHGDPKQQLHDDLVRMKDFIEANRPPREGAQAGQASSSPILH